MNRRRGTPNDDDHVISGEAKALAHFIHFRRVSAEYPAVVSTVYRHQLNRAMSDDDATVAARVAEWEKNNGLQPRDWAAIGRDERGDNAA